MKEESKMVFETQNTYTLLANVIQFLPNPVFVKDAQHRWIMLNQAFTSFFGKTPDEMLGKSDYDFFPKEEADIFWEKDDWVFRNKEVNENEESFTDSKGIQRWILTRKTVFVDDAGQPILVGVITDLTERKRAESELQQAIAKAEEAARVKGEFLANMSHEIRTPLNAITGFNHLLQQTNLNEQQREYIENSLQATEHLMTIVNQILDFSKIEVGLMKINHLPFHLSTLVERVFKLMSSAAQAKQLKLLYSPASELQETYLGDAQRIEQILINLVNNAVKFTDQGKVSVSIRPTQTGLHFTVQDTGIGIAQEKQPLLFSAFTQVDASSTRSYGGTGLGLSISQSLVGLMQGSMGFESQAGQGSSFWFEIPLQAIEENCEQNTSAQTSETQPSSLNLTHIKPRILLVEDDLVNQLITRKLLEIRGCEVDIANHGQEALEQLEKTPYNLVFMDMQMPVMDGLSAIIAIRSQTHYQSVPIIALTADAQRETRHKALSTGANDVMTKPLDLAILDIILQKWLSDLIQAR
jgi:PAS domain S-box-containing protein